MLSDKLKKIIFKYVDGRIKWPSSYACTSKCFKEFGFSNRYSYKILIEIYSTEITSNFVNDAYVTFSPFCILEFSSYQGHSVEILECSLFKKEHIRELFSLNSMDYSEILSDWILSKDSKEINDLINKTLNNYFLKYNFVN